MDLISPPTDNMYKFICVSGLILIVFCLYMVQSNISTRDEAVQQIQEQQAVTRLELEFLNSDEAESDSTYRVKHLEVPDEIKQEFIKRRRELKIKIAKQEVLVTNNSRMVEYLERDFKTYTSFAITGIVYTLLGLYLWYTRSQKYIDQKLKREAS